MTSSEWIGKIAQFLVPTIIYILELNPLSSVKLFMEITGVRDFKPEEVLALVNKNPKNCLELLLPKFTASLGIDVEEISHSQNE